MKPDKNNFQFKHTGSKEADAVAIFLSDSFENFKGHYYGRVNGYPFVQKDPMKYIQEISVLTALHIIRESERIIIMKCECGALSDCRELSSNYFGEPYRDSCNSERVGMPQEFTPYQLCPKCEGSGYKEVEKWAWNNEFTVLKGMEYCDICKGKKIIPMYKNNAAI